MAELPETVFVVQHTYAIKPDETLIDREMESWDYNGQPGREEDNTRFHRMFQAIGNDPKALQRMMVYLVLSRHEDEMGDEAQLIEEHFGKEDLVFADMLASMAQIFESADQQWIRDMRRKPRHVVEEEFGPLEKALQGNCSAQGWKINKLVEVKSHE